MGKTGHDGYLDIYGSTKYCGHNKRNVEMVAEKQQH